MLPPHIHSADDLVTNNADTLSGFLQQARTKMKRAEPYINEAKAFYAELKAIENVHTLAAQVRLHRQLITAAGFSDKAYSHLRTTGLQEILDNLFTEATSNADGDWREDILFRFLLTRGDSLGGTMRNVTGAVGGAQVVGLIYAELNRREIPFRELVTKAGKVQALQWPHRVLLFDQKPRFVGKNIDFILLDASSLKPVERLREDACHFLACGELKSGIDPAGADEHWKTANKAFERIRTACQPQSPKLFFIGAAIQNSMSIEIFNQLLSGELNYAANLTKPEQIEDLVSWLVQL